MVQSENKKQCNNGGMRGQVDPQDRMKRPASEERLSIPPAQSPCWGLVQIAISFPEYTPLTRCEQLFCHLLF